ncbi:hypothetical protein C8N24_3939 [Solirubrobacter pauli]|uniref:Uncharacterized protein n=1 Tax=Solirubrobacter pauli TaxID=166793 RepID=A0A660LG54_9ACTN|nr:hypothetical protein [Solirubrobacter pauli]RKQ94062.1 hypothetical protein C8N24_3939 [Solirubrobacter pauli]
MTTRLTAEVALAYVRELSTDFRAGIVLNGALEPIAGDRELAAAARALFEAHPDARELQAGAVFAARGEDRAIVVVTGEFALQRVTRGDLRTALFGAGVSNAQEGSLERPQAALVKALVTASADAFRRHRAV